MDAAAPQEKYLAIGIAGCYPRFITADNLDLYERLIVEGAWWDFVDDVAIHLVGCVLALDPAAAKPVVERWIRSEDMWLRRSAIISQNKLKAATDFDLMRCFVMGTAHEKAFFIRKAIGWALREYAKTEPEAVRTFVEEMGDRLSGRSRREALKNL